MPAIQQRRWSELGSVALAYRAHTSKRELPDYLPPHYLQPHYLEPDYLQRRTALPSLRAWPTSGNKPPCYATLFPVPEGTGSHNRVMSRVVKSGSLSETPPYSSFLCTSLVLVRESRLPCSCCTRKNLREREQRDARLIDGTEIASEINSRFSSVFFWRNNQITHRLKQIFLLGLCFLFQVQVVFDKSPLDLLYEFFLFPRQADAPRTGLVGGVCRG
jgi:hypothetical protein